MTRNQIMSIESNLQQALFRQDNEKTFIDKILARNEVDQLRDLIKKSRLTREEMLEALYLVSGTEAKLLNLSEWDRYVILKFFVWLREFAKILELFFDYREFLEEKAETAEIQISPRFKKMLDNNERLLEHNVKFLLDLYLNIGRTSLSVGATGFMELLTNKFEMAYPQMNTTTPQQQSRGGIFKRS